jgi:hypothetical protein
MSVRCSANDRKGQQCGRRVKDGSNPPLCHIHKTGTPTGTPFKRRRKSDEEIIEDLLGSDNDSTRLRALELRRELERDRQTAKTSFDLIENELLRATDDDRDELLFHCGAIRVIRERVRTQPLARPSQDEVNAQVNAAVTAPAPEIPPVPLPSDKPRPSAPSNHVEATLPRGLWYRVGIYETKSGTITHANGDEYAADVLTGVIAYDDALAAQERALHQKQTLTASFHED